MTVSVEGFAIVSRDGMLAGADGLMPDSLKFERDQEFLDQALDAAALLIHGRKSHEAQENSCKRRRLLLTRSAGAVLDDARSSPTSGWNPGATPFPQVREALGIESGVVAILGGTAAYECSCRSTPASTSAAPARSRCPAACRCFPRCAKAARRKRCCAPRGSRLSGIHAR